MKPTILATTLAVLCLVFTTAVAANAHKSSGTLTEDIVKKAIKDNFTTLYKEYPSVQVEFGPIRIAPKKAKFGVIGKNQSTVVNPVKVVVTIKVTRSDGSSFDVKRGEKPDEVFLFYQNEFDEWSFRIGSSGN